LDNTGSSACRDVIGYAGLVTICLGRDQDGSFDRDGSRRNELHRANSNAARVVPEVAQISPRDNLT